MIGPGLRDRRAWSVSLLIVLFALFAACTYVGMTDAEGAGCDVKVAAPANLQDRLLRAGPGATVCLTGTFSTKTTVVPRSGQTIIGGHLKYIGPIHLCERCTNFVDGFSLHYGHVTLRNVEVSGFEGKGVQCGPYSVIRDSYLHDNKQNGIGCIAQQGDWHIQIIGNRISNNGSRILEGYGSGGVKLMELSRPGHALGAGATITGNIASGNIGNGLWLDRASNATIVSNNRAFGNTRRGFRAEKSAGPILVEGNTMFANGLEGIDITDTGVATVKGNVTYSNGKGGITIRLDARAKKRYPTLGDVTTGWFIHDVRVLGTHLAKDGVVGCNLKGVTCKA